MACLLAGLLALISLLGDRASGAGTLVVIEDASQLGSGSFSGNVCYQVVRASDGVTMSEGCFSIAATIAAPEGFDTSEQYTIYVSLADENCDLLDDPRTGNGAIPFSIRVSCDDAFLTATANAGGAIPTETPAMNPGEGSAPVELTAWPPVYDLPTATTLEPVPTLEPVASPIPMADIDGADSIESGDAPAGGRNLQPDAAEPTHDPAATAQAPDR